MPSERDVRPGTAQVSDCSGSSDSRSSKGVAPGSARASSGGASVSIERSMTPRALMIVVIASGHPDLLSPTVGSIVRAAHHPWDAGPDGRTNVRAARPKTSSTQRCSRAIGSGGKTNHHRSSIQRGVVGVDRSLGHDDLAHGHRRCRRRRSTLGVRGRAVGRDRPPEAILVTDSDGRSIDARDGPKQVRDFDVDRSGRRA